MLLFAAGFNVITIVICQYKNNQMEIILMELNLTVTGPDKLIARDLLRLGREVTYQVTETHQKVSG